MPRKLVSVSLGEDRCSERWPHCLTFKFADGWPIHIELADEHEYSQAQEVVEAITATLSKESDDMEHGGNWKIVVMCALERCLMGQCYVDYAVRDYILTNHQHFTKQEIGNMRDIIRQYAQPKNKVAFWADFLDKLMKLEGIILIDK